MSKKADNKSGNAVIFLTILCMALSTVLIILYIVNVGEAINPFGGFAIYTLCVSIILCIVKVKMFPKSTGNTKVTPSKTNGVFL